MKYSDFIEPDRPIIRKFISSKLYTNLKDLVRTAVHNEILRHLRYMKASNTLQYLEKIQNLPIDDEKEEADEQ